MDSMGAKGGRSSHPPIQPADTSLFMKTPLQEIRTLNVKSSSLGLTSASWKGSRRFCLRRLVSSQAPPVPRMDHHSPNLSHVYPDCAINWCSQTTLGHEPPLVDGFRRDCCCCTRLQNKTRKQPRSSAPPPPDCGGLSERIWERRRSDEVEHAGRGLTIPLWQNWDGGQKLLLPMIAPTEPGRATSHGGPAGAEGLWSTDEEAELRFTHTPFGVNDGVFALDQDGVPKATESSANPNTPVHGEEGGPDADVLERHFRMSTGDPRWLSSDLPPASFGSAESSPGLEMQDEHGDPLTCPDLADQPGTKLQDVGEEQSIAPEFGDLPEDLSEFFDEDLLGVVLRDPFWNCEDEPSKSGVSSEMGASLQPRQEAEGASPPKRLRVSQSPPPPPHCDPLKPPSQCDEASSWQIMNAASHIGPLDANEENNGRRKKQEVKERRQKRGKKPASEPQASQSHFKDQETGRVNLAETRSENADVSGSSPGTSQGLQPGPSDVSTTPPRILQLPPSLRLITIQDPPLYQLVQTMSISSPVITIPVASAASTPTFIFVPAVSTPLSPHPPPLSPADGTVAPVQMSSSPPGSLSDTASRAMPPPRASPPSPINEVVRAYILKAKEHTSQTCEDMEGGLSLSSHYVERQVSQRELVYRCKKSQDKELLFMGDTHRQKSLLGPNQIFEGSSGHNPKRYILLLGNAGMGKSTLIKKLCLDWTRDRFPQFDFVFLLEGKMLTLTKPAFSLQTLLLNLSSLATACPDQDAVYAQVKAAPKRVLVIFDGFAEISDFETLLQPQEKDLMASLQKDSKAQTYTVKLLYAAILQRALLPGCTLLLSARPRGTASQVLRRTDSYLEMCGFSLSDVETYASRYFADPTLRESALECLKSQSYLHLLCWNPGLCWLVCSVLGESGNVSEFPRTLTELCRQVLDLRLRGCANALPATSSAAKPGRKVKSVKPRPVSSSGHHVEAQPKSSRSAEVKEEEEGGVGEEAEDLLSQLSSLAWDGVKAHSPVVPGGWNLCPRLKAFGHRTGLLVSHDLRTRHLISSGEIKGGGSEAKGQRKRGKNVCKDSGIDRDQAEDHILMWASPYLQSYLAALHLCLSRFVSQRTFFQSFPLLSGPKYRRRSQREGLELTQRFAFGILMEKLETLAAKDSLRDLLISKQTSVNKHLEDLSHVDLSPAQLLEACHYVHQHLIHGTPSRKAELKGQLVAKLPEVLAFRGVPLNPLDAFVLRQILEIPGGEGDSYSLDLEDSGIQLSGLKALVGLSSVNTYRACIDDVITLWDQLEQSGEEKLRQNAVSKFNIHPLKATQVCHIEQLAKLVNVHMQKRFPGSSGQSDPILAEGVPAVTKLHKLEFELGPEKGPKALPKLWELLPGLHHLQHLDLEKSEIGDSGAERLAAALVSLGFLEVLNLSQNCIGDQGMTKLASTLRDLPKLHCLSLYSNMISDEGAKSLAAVLPHMTSLTNLDIKYNKLTDVGAESLGVSLRKCKNIKTLRMWNECIPYGVFERLQMQDSRILWH